jgi:serpin B
VKLLKTMKITVLILLAILVGMPLAACAAPTQPPGPATPDPATPPSDTPMPPLETTPGEPPVANVAFSNLERDTSPEAPPGDLVELVAGNQAFAFDFYQAVREEEGNLFYSPHSLLLALAMTYAGARGETAEQFAETLNFRLPQERLHPAFNALDLELAARGEQDEPGEDENRRFQLNIANSVWGQQGYPFLPEYLDLLAVNYGSGLRLVDYAADPEAARLAINDWVSEQTEARIQDLIPPGAIDVLTRLVLANAIYFNAAWLYPFEENLTQDMPFNLLDGSQVNTPMMTYSIPERLNYGQGAGYQAVELPYLGDEVAMLVLAPDEGTFSEFEASLDAAKLEAILAGLEPKTVALFLPKFEFETQFSLAETLAAMGMPVAFDPNLADFSGMDGSRELYITDVIHKAFVAVDEEGTEAAAATGVVVGVTSLPMEDVRLVVDRPFIFAIRDVPTGELLFVGRVLNPGE